MKPINDDALDLRTINGESDVDSLENSNNEMLEESGSSGCGSDAQDEDEEGCGCGSDESTVINIKAGNANVEFVNIFAFFFQIEWGSGALTQNVNPSLKLTSQGALPTTESVLCRNVSLQPVSCKWSGVNGAIMITTNFSYEYYPQGFDHPETMQTRYSHADFIYNVPSDYITSNT